jgi:hypothetical protein
MLSIESIIDPLKLSVEESRVLSSLDGNQLGDLLISALRMKQDRIDRCENCWHYKSMKALLGKN